MINLLLFKIKKAVKIFSPRPLEIKKPWAESAHGLVLDNVLRYQHTTGRSVLK
jgi:hypothetical protein